MDISVEPSAEPKPKEPSLPSKEVEMPVPAPTADVEIKDVEMPDAEETLVSLPPVAQVEEMPDAPNTEPAPEHPQASLELPPSPWPTKAPTTQVETKSLTEPTEKPTEKREGKPVNMRLEMPEKPDTASLIPSPNALVTPGSVSNVSTGSAVVQSPVVGASAPSPFS